MEIAINKLIKSNNRRIWKKGIYFRDITEQFINTLNSPNCWGIETNINGRDFDYLVKIPFDSIIKGRIHYFNADFALQYKSFKIKGLSFGTQYVEFELEADLISRFGKQRISKTNEINIHFLSSVVYFVENISGWIELNNSVYSKYPFSSMNTNNRIPISVK